MEYFNGIGEISFESAKSKNPLAFKHYKVDEKIGGKMMKEHIPGRASPTKLSIRILAKSNENHHLWNNHGVWSVNYTVHPTPNTKRRIRFSLNTKSVEEARRMRDRIFDEQLTGQYLARVR